MSELLMPLFLFIQGGNRQLYTPLEISELCLIFLNKDLEWGGERLELRLYKDNKTRYEIYKFKKGEKIRKFSIQKYFMGLYSYSLKPNENCL